MTVRASVRHFALANAIYRGASVSFYTVVDGVKTAVLATLYAGTASSVQLANPQKLNARGQLKQTVYIEDAVIATVEGISVPSHDTGIQYPYAEITWPFDVAASGLRLGINSAAPTGNILRILQNSALDDDVGISTVVFIQRQVGLEEGFENPKALRVHTEVNVETVQNEWAISGEVDYNEDATGTGNCVSVSGVTNRYSPSQNQTVFAGHFQIKDWNEYAAATAVAVCVGVEMNIAAYGLDHPTSNSSNGSRLILSLIAKNNPDIAATNTEIGRGLRISTEGAANGGYFRTALHIDEASANANVIQTAIKIETSGDYGIRVRGGAHDVADVMLESDSLYGIILNGAYTNAAMRINDNQYVAWRANNTVRTRFNTSSSRFEWDVSGNLRAELEIDATVRLLLDGVQVLKERETGWTAGTGTPNKAAFAAYAGATMSVGYVQAEAQASNDAAKLANQRCLAIEQAMINHGLIGT